MISELSQKDIDVIWQLVHRSIEKAGSHKALFANGAEMFETSGRFKVQWPKWLSSAQSYLEDKYQDKLSDAILVSVMRDIMSEHKYSAYLKRNENGELPTPEIELVE